MTHTERVVTANLSAELASKLDDVARRIDRSKSWIIRQAIGQWLAEEERRYALTLEAMKDIDEGRFLTQEQVEEHFAAKRRARRDAAGNN
jgi:predicted transcriptional regulator